ncbi:MAG: hypothetical protein OXB86_06090 [Bdellovibrionales bacterium]|nr:hypothetical protein [Bdellovibrionales bacterium]
MTSSRTIFILLFLFAPVILEGAPVNPSLKAKSKTSESQKMNNTFKNSSQSSPDHKENPISITSPRGRKSKIPFSKSLPEDISNENFPDIIESFDYPNVPLMDLIQAIGKLTGLNFIIDPGVANKKITILAPSKITVAEAYKAFLSALAANGYTVVRSGAFWKIRETKTALKDNTEIYSGGYFPNTDQLITRVIKLKHINAKEFSTSIKPLAGTGQQVSFHEASNTIIISDYGSAVERIMKLVQVMDVPGSEESVTIIPIVHAAATDLAGILNELLSGKPSSSSRTSRRRLRVTSPSKSSVSGNIKVSHIIPDERTNALIVSANESGLKRVKNLVKKLDTYVDPSRTGGIYVYNVLYGTAEQVYNTLMGITPSKPEAKKTSSLPRSSRASIDRRSGSKSLPSSTSALFPNVTIMADPNTNSLIISARNKYDFERVKAVLKKIDVPKDQVFVQAVIVEMYVGQGDSWETNLAGTLMNGASKAIAKNLGFDNTGDVPIFGGFLNRGFAPDESMIKNLSVGPGFILGLPFSKILNSLNLNNNTNTGRQSLDFDQIADATYKKPYEELEEDEQKNINSLWRSQNTSRNRQLDQALNSSLFPILEILKKVGDVNVLSTPQITAMDNVPAIIEVGENAPIGLTTTSSGFGTSNAVDRADLTLRLELTPRINPDSGIIQMDISQTFNDLSSTKSSASELQSRAVHTIKRFIETKLVLHDGETAVLGGLMTDKEVKNENKVPVLGDIPVVGWLFKGSTVQKQKRNLIVFLTPTIIRGRDQKNQNRKLLGKKLEERIEFIRKNMKGKDPYGNFLKKLTAKTMDAPVKPEESDEDIVPDSKEVEWVEEASSLELEEDQEMEMIDIPHLESPSIDQGPVPLSEPPPSIRPSQTEEEEMPAPDPTQEDQEVEWVEEDSEEDVQSPEDTAPVFEEAPSKSKGFFNRLFGREPEESQETETIEESEDKLSDSIKMPPQINEESLSSEEEKEELDEEEELTPKDKKNSKAIFPFSNSTDSSSPVNGNTESVPIENIELFPKE